jgi:hypothetical protein
VERGSKSSGKTVRKVQLLLLEVTKVEEVLPCHLPFRYCFSKYNQGNLFCLLMY